MSLKSVILTGAAIAALSTATVPAYADTILTNQWYTGHFGSTAPSPLIGPGFTGETGTNGPVLPSGTANAMQAPATWSITLVNGGTLTVTDVEESGDQFQLFDNGNPLGTTSTPVAYSVSGAGSVCDEDISCALNDSDFSSGTFNLAAGINVITGNAITILSSGNFDFIVQANAPTGVPEPATLTLLGAGMAGLGFIRRKKR